MCHTYVTFNLLNCVTGKKGRKKANAWNLTLLRETWRHYYSMYRDSSCFSNSIAILNIALLHRGRHWTMIFLRNSIRLRDFGRIVEHTGQAGWIVWNDSLTSRLLKWESIWNHVYSTYIVVNVYYYCYSFWRPLVNLLSITDFEFDISLFINLYSFVDDVHRHRRMINICWQTTAGECIWWWRLCGLFWMDSANAKILKANKERIIINRSMSLEDIPRVLALFSIFG